MAVTVVVETGSGTNAAANSLASVAEIDAIAEAEISMTSWQAQGATETTPKKQAAISASRLLKRWVPWEGAAVHVGQPLPYPRVNTVDENGFAIEGDTVPPCVKEATALMADALLADATREADAALGLSALTVDTIKLVFDRYDRPGVLPRSVKAALRSVADFGSGIFGKARR